MLAHLKQKCVLLIFAVSLCGCTSVKDYVQNGFKVGPNYSSPAAPVECNWIDASDTRIRTDSDDLSKWWTVFNDPVLDGLIWMRLPSEPDVARGGLARAGSPISIWRLPRESFSRNRRALPAISPATP